MKKLLLFSILLLVGLSAYSQTIYYRLCYSVNPNTGEKKSYSGSCYVTFTRGGDACYESDKDGFAVPSYSSAQLTQNKSEMATYDTDWIFKKYSTANGVITYKCDAHYTAPNPFPTMYSWYLSGTDHFFVSFSSDYNRINIIVNDNKIVSGERTYAPGEAPTQDLL